MNWLAHLYLSPPHDPEFRLGNLLADFVKGSAARRELSESFQRGVRCHQAIDAFTDFHPIVGRSRTRIAARHGHFSGILIDVFYDHFLARNWPLFATLSLDDFLNEVHAAAPRHLAGLPEIARDAVARIIAEDRLRSYREVAGIGAALGRLSVYLSTRLRRPVDLGSATAELIAHHSALEADFLEFFPQLCAHVVAWQDEHDDFATPPQPAY